MGPRQVVVQGAREAGKAAFFFLEEILGIIDQVLLLSTRPLNDYFAILPLTPVWPQIEI